MNNYGAPSQNFHIKQNPARSSREFMQSPGQLKEIYFVRSPTDSSANKAVIERADADGEEKEDFPDA